MSHHSRVPTVVGGQFILRLLLVTATVLGIALTSAPAQASKYAGFVIDANTGKTLYSSAADSARYPASLTKMMTLYLVFDALKSGKISKKTRITVLCVWSPTNICPANGPNFPPVSSVAMPLADCPILP